MVGTPENYTIILLEDGTMEGKAACNIVSGTYSQEDDFTITVVPDVMAACDQGPIDQQSITILGEVAAGSQDWSGGLDLENTGGEMRMEFSNGVSVQ